MVPYLLLLTILSALGKPSFTDKWQSGLYEQSATRSPYYSGFNLKWKCYHKATTGSELAWRGDQAKGPPNPSPPAKIFSVQRDAHNRTLPKKMDKKKDQNLDILRPKLIMLYDNFGGRCAH